jgi:hypothetical protein
VGTLLFAETTQEFSQFLGRPDITERAGRPTRPPTAPYVALCECLDSDAMMLCNWKLWLHMEAPNAVLSSAEGVVLNDQSSRTRTRNNRVRLTSSKHFTKLT